MKWVLDAKSGGEGESVSQNFGHFSTFHKLTEQQIFISFISIYIYIYIYIYIDIKIRINTLFI
jgi:hypothetical protein